MYSYSRLNRCASYSCTTCNTYNDACICKMWKYSTLYLCTMFLLEMCVCTGWRHLKGSPKLQIIFHKSATKYRSLLQKMTYEDKGSYESSPTFMWHLVPAQHIEFVCAYEVYINIHIMTHAYAIYRSTRQYSCTLCLCPKCVYVCVCVCVCEREREKDRGRGREKAKERE